MSFDLTDDTDDIMGEINMTPLVDVMLVLLIIFIITVPVLQHSVNVALPVASTAPPPPKPQTLHISIDAQGRYYWNDQAMNEVALFELFKTQAAQDPQPDVHLRADKAVRYEYVATMMAGAQSAGLRHIGFLTEPTP